MQCSRADCKTVYRSLECRRIFCKPQNAALRKEKPIKAIVKKHNLSVFPFSRRDLLQILKQLLREGLSESRSTAQSTFPELFPPPVVPQETTQSTQNFNTNRDLSIMEEQKAWLRRIFTTGEYSDIELVSTEKLYEAHRLVVCSWSPVILQSCEFNATKLAQDNRESSTLGDDAAKASFNFGNDDPQAVDCMVQFFYLWDYEASSSVSDNKNNDDSSSATDVATSDSSFLTLHSRLFTLAHVYDIARLRRLCVEKFQEAARLQWRSDCLLEAAREAYTATPSEVLEMREAIVKVFCEHRELLDEGHVKQFLLEVPHLALDILIQMNKSWPLSGFSRSTWL